MIYSLVSLNNFLIECRMKLRLMNNYTQLFNIQLHFYIGTCFWVFSVVISGGDAPNIPDLIVSLVRILLSVFLCVALKPLSTLHYLHVYRKGRARWLPNAASLQKHNVLQQR